ncbi:ABC transporter G family member 28-like [Dendronephthya gigantea]|uniref:ABC transporter G family member 28-like n=1 Tax=Dendronephthya gigantea TaxID=151771 RepID=UPI00106907FC|nr:ABC transporter G family member 28-like [Dendronephthya gigantea]
MDGFYSTNGFDVLPCPAGYFCEKNQVCLKPCPMGAFCDQNILVTDKDRCGRYKTCCLPYHDTPIFNEHTKAILCPGHHKPFKCLEGFYCPNTTTRLKCPAGHFCREGSNWPVKCLAISNCGEGGKSPNTLYIGIIFNSCLLAIFLFILLYFNNRRKINFYFDLYFRRIRGKRTLSQRYNLRDGIRLAISRLTIDQDVDEGTCLKKNGYDISFEKLSLTLTTGENKGKVLLQGVTGEIRAGQVTAVLGPSGAGKTTFLNVLCGKAYYGNAGGIIKVNGKKVTGMQDYKGVTGFVPQDDIMHRSLTAKEVLYYNAVLRLPPPSDVDEYERIVKRVMSFLGIKSIANTQIGDEETRGISGGQRRRVNIGMELVADPTILFLDEPTTGLDSSTSLVVVKALNTVASSTNMTICCVIHQPRFEILKLFDRVIFLGYGGRTVYSGSVEGAATYFSKIGYPLPLNVNPADFYMDVISGSVSGTNVYVNLFEEWEKHETIVDEVGAEVRSDVIYGEKDVGIRRNGSSAETTGNTPLNEVMPGGKSSDETSVVTDVTLTDFSGRNQNEAIQVDPSPCPESGEGKAKIHRLGFFSQLGVFLKREFVLQLRMSKTLLLDQAMALIAGAALGLLFREITILDVPEATVFGNIAVGQIAVVAALRGFGLHRMVFWRESAAGINRLSYFLAVNLSNIPVLLISPAVYLSIYYSIASFLAPFALHYAVFVCAWYYLSGLGYIMSLLMTPRNSQMAAVVTTVIMALLSGGTPELCKLDDTFIATILYNLSFSRWVAEAIFEVEARENSEALGDLVSRMGNVNHYDLNSYNLCVGVLLALGTGFRIIALFLFLFTKRGQQK